MGVLYPVFRTVKLIKQYRKTFFMILFVWFTITVNLHVDSLKHASSIVSRRSRDVNTTQDLVNMVMRNTVSENPTLGLVENKSPEHIHKDMDKTTKNSSETVRQDPKDQIKPNLQAIKSLGDLPSKPAVIDEKHFVSKGEQGNLTKITGQDKNSSAPETIKSTNGSTSMNNISAPAGTVHDFPYIINNKSICEGVNLTYLIYVHTAPKNRDRRLQLRQTWAKNSVIPNYPSRLIFMVANPHDEKVQNDLYEESKIYGDIIQEDFVDSYRNLSHKAVGALKWITTFCDKVKFVIKTDDDVFTDIFRVLKLMKEKYWHSKRYILGLLWNGNMPILRNPKNCAKWCVKESDFKGKRFYPRYMSGGCLVLSGDLIKELYLASKRTPFFWVDDVYLSGLLPMKLQNVTYYNIGNMYKYNQKHYAEAQFDTKNPGKFLVTLTQNKLALWEKTLFYLSDENKLLLGKDHHANLTAEAKKLAQVEKEKAKH